MEVLVLILFVTGLLCCILFDFSIIYALCAGLILFLLYGLRKGYPFRTLLRVSLEGVIQAKNILTVFILIGVMTAFWRAAGTIPVIVSAAVKLVHPSVYLLMAFLLNCGMSVLTGTSFGTAATMGVICAAMGRSMNVHPVLIGGAILAGVFFGDRCSPVSTSALLTAQLTETDIYTNIRNMVRTALVPFLISCFIYTAIGFTLVRGGTVPDLQELFSGTFSLHWAAVLPAAVIVLMAVLHMDVKLAMTASIVCSVPICLLQQHIPAGQLLPIALRGFRAADPDIAAMINGGGILSMLKVAGIVSISSCYAGLFRKTGLLNGIQEMIRKLASRTSSYTAMLLTSVVTGMIACTQTLSIMLTKQLCDDLEQNPEELAIDLEDSAVVTAPLIPWSIAGGVPLATVGAPAGAILFAFFLYLLPAWRLAVDVAGMRHAGKVRSARNHRK